MLRPYRKVVCKREGYNLLAATYYNAPHGDIIVVMDDLNANRTTLEHVLGNQGMAYATTMVRGLLISVTPIILS